MRELKDEIDEELLKRFNFVLENENYEDYKKFDNELLLARLRSNCEEIKPKYEILEEKHDDLRDQLEEILDLNESMLNSFSWKITEPLRNFRGRR